MKLLRGFVLFGLVLPAYAQYAGPAILSRGEAPAAMTAPTVDFAFSLALTGNYTNGLVGVSTNAQGLLPSSNSYGGGVTLGVSGSHRWKHTTFGMSYSGGFSDYESASYFAGLSQGISAGLTHQFSRHILFSLREAAGWFTVFPPATVSLNSSVPFDPSQSYIPTTDFYDNRTIYSTTQADLTYQVSTRLSFDFGGGYFTNLRRSSALYSASGETASGDAQYRLSRRTTLGAAYSHSQYGYTKSQGGATIDTAGLSVSMRFSRWTEFSFFGGASRVNSSFVQIVPPDPSLLAIVCPPILYSENPSFVCPLQAGTVKPTNILWAPNFGARLSRSFQRGVAYISAGESITPGNGLFLTSRAATASAGYGYSGLRRWSLSAGVSYITALSLGNVQGAYGEVTGSFGVSRQVKGPLSFVSSFGASQYRSGSFSPYNRLIYTGSVGLGFSSKNIPVRLF